VHCMESDIQILDWSARSSDANPIENMCPSLRGKRVFTLKQLCRHVRAIWRLSQQYAENLIENMSKVPANSR